LIAADHVGGPGPLSRSSLDGQRSTQIEQITLSNGMRVVVVPQPHLLGATLSVFVKVGPRYEQLEKNGISHFLEHMLFRGTPRYATTYELSYAAEALGGSLEAATYADFTHFQISVPAEHSAEALRLLADLFAGPRFAELELEKRIVKEEILADLDADGREVDAENLSRMQVYGEHPLGFKITGTADNVESFGLEDLHAHLRQHYGAANMAVVATGAVECASIFALSAELFSSRERGTLTLIDSPPPPRHDRRLSFVKNDASQSDVRVCFRAFGSDDPDFIAFKLLNRILDDGMSTRLHQRLTDESGLAYEVFAGLDPYEETGLLEIGASVTHDKAPSVIAAVLSLLSELRDTEVGEAELEKARTRYRWHLRRITDSAEDMALWAGTQTIFGRSMDLGELLEALAKVTPADVQAVARRLARPENTYISVVGRTSKPVQKACAKVLEQWSAAPR
jgi:predicted Zn-dependent peptidase